MAIEITERKLPLNQDQVRQFLQSQTDSFGVFIDLERCNEYMYIVNSGIRETAALAKKLTGSIVMLEKKQQIINLLINFGVPAQLFGNGSLNKEIITQVIENPATPEPAKVLARIYQKYKYLTTRLNTLTAYVTKLDEDETRWSDKGRRMLCAHPTWKTLSTSRQATSEPNVQAIAKDFSDLVVAPEGYNLVRCDSNQIEPRITWSYFIRDDLIVNLITLYGDAYYGLLAYCLLSDEEERLYRSDFSQYQKREFDKEKRSQLKVLSLAGTYGSTNLDKVDRTLADAFTRKIVNHPKRLELQSKVETQVNSGVEIFHGYFGSLVVPDTTERYHKGSSEWKSHVIRCGVNNPVQTTASELMTFSVAEAMKILAKAKDTHVAYYKHDEACFYVSDEDKANGILDELSEITAYNVAGWIPIPCETQYGTLESSIESLL